MCSVQYNTLMGCYCTKINIPRAWKSIMVLVGTAINQQEYRRFPLKINSPPGVDRNIIDAHAIVVMLQPKILGLARCGVLG